MLFQAFAVVFFIVSSILVGTATVAWRRIESPTVDLFAIVAGTLGMGGLIISAGFAANSPVFVLGATISVAMLIPLPWIMFSFDYLGREELITTWTVGSLAIPVTVGLAATIAIFASQIFPWLTFLSQDDSSGLVVVVTTVLELSQWGAILYAGGLVLTGTGLVLWSFQRYPHLDSTTGTVLCAFGTVPWVSVLFALQLESTSFLVFSGTVAIGFGIGAIAAVALAGPSPLFDRVPAAGNVGPKTVIEELEDAVVITDGDGQIISLNPSARRRFDRGQGAVGLHITDLFESSLAELRDRTPVEIESESRQALFDPTVSELTDQHGHLLGYAIVLRDVTGPTIRKQRLEVLNRLLRHNLRNDMTVVLGRLDVIRTQVDDPDVVDNVEAIAETGQGLVDLSEKIRKSEKLLAIDSRTTQQMQIESLVRQIFGNVGSDQDIECHYQGREEIAIVATRDELQVALRNLVDNAVQHNDSASPEVWVRTAHRSEKKYSLEIAVLDNGPGIPERERKAITRGQETSLEHSSGVGLWTVRWIIRNLGGKISFENRDPTGTVVKLSFPMPSAEFRQTDDTVAVDSLDDGR